MKQAFRESKLSHITVGAPYILDLLYLLEPVIFAYLSLPYLHILHMFHSMYRPCYNRLVYHFQSVCENDTIHSYPHIRNLNEAK